MRYKRKHPLGNRKSQTGRLATALSLSLYPAHVDLLRQRERELNIPRSLLLQLLLDVEASRNLLRQEVLKRLKALPREEVPL